MGEAGAAAARGKDGLLGAGRQRHNVFRRLHKAGHQPDYSALKPLLEDHAKQLAKAIDHRHSR
ncbi:hypothetical protein OG806_01440 [Streptomyces sp. NBC_00882]|uniref:hypothetical protein n=1 Tax=Streptomyces TaxID=1883 RepID=UPI00386C8442|nr:hypothetical protein OG806_01440 [Streptomyces sp. NBC_00882]WSZ55230.1 hypothetical protein OH824_01035 [Streptomyces canus]